MVEEEPDILVKENVGYLQYDHAKEGASYSVHLFSGERDGELAMSST
jgi:hypothetical protein